MLAHFIVSDDVERSRRFYTDVLGGRVVFGGGVTYVALSNSWIIINVGGGLTDGCRWSPWRRLVISDRVSSFLVIRVKDIAAVYAEWSARGAHFLTLAETAPVRDALLHPRSRRSPDRSGPDHRTRKATGRPLTGHRVRPPRRRSECRITANPIDGGHPH